MAIEPGILDWLLEGDVSIQFQVRRDLLGETDDTGLQARIEHEGWGRQFLEQRRPDGHWGRGFYMPKWTSTHYTLLDLRLLELPASCAEAGESAAMVAREHKGEDGGINPAGTIKESDVCVNGMFLLYACYFGVGQDALRSVIDFILAQHMPDGGFNCRRNRSGARHSSMHSTISLLDGLSEYDRRGYSYRLEEVRDAARAGREFLLQHRLYLSDRTGELIDPKFLMLSFPGRWHYDILRALEHFRAAGTGWDARLQPAIEVLVGKRRRDGRWPLQARHPGQTHFEMESTGKASRWNTLRALRVLEAYREGA